MQIDIENQLPANGKIAPNTRPAAEIANVLASVADTSIQPAVAAEAFAANPVAAAELLLSSATLAMPALNFAFDDEIREQIKPGSTSYDDTPRLSGSAEIGAIVMIYDGDQLLGSVQAIDGGPVGGMWSFTVPTPLAAGEHALTVTATGSDGVESAHSDPFAITISDDLRPATIEKAYNDDGEFVKSIADGGVARDTTPQLSGRGESGAIVSIYDGDTLLGTAVVYSPVGGLGVWNFTSPALSPGEHVFTVTIKQGVDGVESPRSAPYTVNVEIAPTPSMPSIDSVLDSIGPVIGPVGNGGHIDDPRPALIGRGEPGAIVTISYGDQVLGTAKVQASGSWTYRVPADAALGNDTYTFIATQQTDNSQASEPSQPFQIEVTTNNVPVLTPPLPITDSVPDTEAPAAPAPTAPTIDSVSDNVGSSTGIVGKGGRTDDATPDLRGRGQPGATVTISYGDEVLGTAQVQANGSWTYRVPADAALGDGTYTFVATQQVGNDQASEPSLPYQVEVNTAPWAPMIESIIDNVDNSGGDIVVGKGGRTDDATPELQGRGLAGATVTISYGDQVLGTAQVDAKGRWSYQVPADAPLGDDTYAFVATQQVGNGQPSLPSSPYQIEVAASAPVPALAPTINQVIDDVDNPGGGQVVVGTGGQTDDATPKLWGVGQAGATVTISHGDQVLGTAKADGFGRWEYQVPADAPLAYDTYSFVATQLGANGQTSAPSEPYVITVLAELPPPVPTPTLSAPTIDSVLDDVGPVTGVVGNGGSTDDRTVLISGTGEPGADLIIDFGNGVGVINVPVDADGRWSHQLSGSELTVGANSLIVKQFLGSSESDWSEPYVVNLGPDASAIESVLDVEAPLNLDALASAQAGAEEPAMAKLTLDDVLTAHTTELFVEANMPVGEAADLVEIKDLMAEGAWDAQVELASPTDLGGVEYGTQQAGLVDQLVQDQIVTV